MPTQDRRWLLRSNTQALHQELDDRVGAIADIRSYQRYLQGMMRFRGPLERRLAEATMPEALAGFTPSYIADALERDLQTVTRSALPEQEEASDLDLSTSENVLGTLYVLEGSALGARFLVKRAAALGLDENNGAEHLVKQSATTGNWKTFLALLETAGNLDDQVMATAASRTFTAALRAFEKS